MQRRGSGSGAEAAATAAPGPFLLTRRAFAAALIASIVCLALLCVHYGASFGPGIGRRLRGDSPFEDAEDDRSSALGRLRLGGGAAMVGDAVVTAKSIPVCDMRLSELIPCLDRNLIYRMKLKPNLTLMEHYERHCPPQERRFNCLIPPPRGYRVPIKWPASRDEVWKANIPHTHLASEKSDQNWMVVNGDKINFPGGGTHFHTGAAKYILAIANVYMDRAASKTTFFNRLIPTSSLSSFPIKNTFVPCHFVCILKFGPDHLLDFLVMLPCFWGSVDAEVPKR